MKIVTCHNRACRYRLPIHRALYSNGNLFCSPKCRDGCSPPASDKAAAVSALTRPSIKMAYDFR